MNLSEFIINDIKPVAINSKVAEVQHLFNQLTYSHIPVVDNADNYIGCVSETDAYCFETTKHLTEYRYALEQYFVRETASWLSVLETFAQNGTNIMPVLAENGRYLGYYELSDIMGLFNQTPFFAEPGGVLIVEKGLNDYSYSEIAQIIESNNAKILGVFISKIENERVQFTIKISSSELNEVIQTFRRYSYSIVSGHEDDSFTETLKERSDYLNKYLNI